MYAKAHEINKYRFKHGQRRPVYICDWLIVLSLDTRRVHKFWLKSLRPENQCDRKKHAWMTTCIIFTKNIPTFVSYLADSAYFLILPRLPDRRKQFGRSKMTWKTYECARIQSLAEPFPAQPLRYSGPAYWQRPPSRRVQEICSGGARSATSSAGCSPRSYFQNYDELGFFDWCAVKLSSLWQLDMYDCNSHQF